MTSQRYMESKPASKQEICSENSPKSCHYTVCWCNLCWCVILVHVNISSVCWHGMADTSCVREVPKPLWPTSWNSGQWGHWSWDLSIWQHRRWALLHGTLSELLCFCSSACSCLHLAQRQRAVLLDNWDRTRTGLCLLYQSHFQNIPPPVFTACVWEWSLSGAGVLVCVWEPYLFFMPTRDGKK